MSQPIRAAFFDFGGTLFSYRTWGRGSGTIVKEATRRLGVEADGKTRARAYGEANQAAFTRFREEPYYLHRDLFLEIYRRYAEALGAHPDDAWYEWFYEAQRDLAIGGVTLREDCLATLAALRERGLYLSIVSNIDDDYLHPMVERAELGDVLHHWSSSEEARSCKPHEGIFELALRKADCSPKEVLFVGDSPAHDVVGAKRLGMTTVLIAEDGIEAPGNTGSQAPDPDHVIRELGELLSIVAR